MCSYKTFFSAAAATLDLSPAELTVASLIRLASSHVTPSKICDCGPADILSARRLSLILNGTTNLKTAQRKRLRNIPAVELF